MIDDENRVRNISTLSDKLIEVEKKARKIEAELKSDFDMLTAHGGRTEKEIKKLKKNLLIDRQTAGILNRTLRNVGMAVNVLSKGVEKSSNFLRDYGRTVEEFKFNKTNVAGMAISAVAGLPVGYFVSRIFETEAMKNLSYNIKTKTGEMIRRALKMEKAKHPEDFEFGAGEIPKLQKGGYVKRGGLAKVHPAEVVMPVEKLLAELRKQQTIMARGTPSSPGQSHYLAKIAESTAETAKLIKTMHKSSGRLERNMVKALEDLKVAMIGTTDQWRIYIQSKLLRHPIIRKYMMATDMLKSFVSTPIRWLFGKRGGYEGAAAQAQKTDNVFEKSSNLLSLIFRYTMPRLDKIINLLQVAFEEKIKRKEKGAPEKEKSFFESLRERAEEDPIYTQIDIIRKWMRGETEKKTKFARILEYLTDSDPAAADLEEYGITGFKSLLSPRKILKQAGITSENIKIKRLDSRIAYLKNTARFIQDPEYKSKIAKKISLLERYRRILVARRDRKEEERAEPSMQRGGFIKKSGKIKAHAAEVIMPVEKFFEGVYIGGKNLYEQKKKIAKEKGSEAWSEIKGFGKKYTTKETYGPFKEGIKEKYRTSVDYMARKKEEIKESQKWREYRDKSIDNLNRIKDYSKKQFEEAKQHTKEFKELRRGLKDKTKEFLATMLGMIGTSFSVTKEILSSIFSGITTLGGITAAYIGGKIGARRLILPASAYMATKKGFSAVGKGISYGITGLDKLIKGGVKAPIVAAQKLPTALGYIAKPAKKVLGALTSAAWWTGKTAAKTGARAAIATGKIGAGVAAGTAVGTWGIGKSIFRAVARSPYLAGLLTLYDAYSMGKEAKDIGVRESAARVGGLLTTGREGGLFQGVLGLFKGAGIGAIVGGAIGSIVPGVGTVVGAALGSKIGAAGIAGLSFLGGDRISKLADSVLGSMEEHAKKYEEISKKYGEVEKDIYDNLGTVSPTAISETYGMGAKWEGVYEPDLDMQISNLREALQNPKLSPKDKERIEKQLEELEYKRKQKRWTGRTWDPKQGAKKVEYEISDVERMLGVPLFSSKERKPSKVVEEWISNKGGLAITEKEIKKEAEKQKQMKDIGEKVIKPVVEQLDIAQKGIAKGNTMIASTINNQTTVISNLHNSNIGRGGGNFAGYGLDVGSNDIARLIFATMDG